MPSNALHNPGLRIYAIEPNLRAAIPEVIGDCGIVVEENNPSALAKAISDLAADPQRRMDLGKRGQQRFEEHFSCQAYTVQLSDALGISS